MSDEQSGGTVRPPTYVPGRVYAAELVTRLVDPESLAAGAETTVQFLWDWAISGPDEVSVTFGVSVNATPVRHEELRAVMVASFAVPDTSPIPLDLFVASNAVVMLFPYLRAAIGSLTVHSAFGPYLLPLANPALLAQQLDHARTDGHRALAADAALRARWARLLSAPYATAVGGDERVGGDEGAGEAVGPVVAGPNAPVKRPRRPRAGTSPAAG